MEDPLCSDCRDEGVVREFDVLDHVVALTNGGEDVDENLRRLCNEHHREKTARDMGYRLIEQTGPDGWPVKSTKG
jgi:5-methylcytosine-specific restriction enzyme A